MVAIVTRERINAQIVHVTEEAIEEMSALLQSRDALGQRCFRISRSGTSCVMNLDLARDNDVALEVDSQLLLVMDRAAVRSFAGKALHYDAEECEFCWLHLEK